MIEHPSHQGVCHLVAKKRLVLLSRSLVCVSKAKTKYMFQPDTEYLHLFTRYRNDNGRYTSKHLPRINSCNPHNHRMKSRVSSTFTAEGTEAQGAGELAQVHSTGENSSLSHGWKGCWHRKGFLHRFWAASVSLMPGWAHISTCTAAHSHT